VLIKYFIYEQLLILLKVCTEIVRGQNKIALLINVKRVKRNLFFPYISEFSNTPSKIGKHEYTIRMSEMKSPQIDDFEKK